MVAVISILATVFTGLLVSQRVSGQQQPFATQVRPAATEQLRPLSSDGSATFASIGDDSYSVLSHRDFPDHRVRIRETTGYCDPSVRSYSGYLDVDSHGKELFFQYFESRSNPAKDDVLLWINGGPGSSSATGLYFELGPCKIVDPTRLNGTEPNPYSWNSQANIFFLDQPVGVGGSYAENGQEVARTEQAAVDLQAFIALFYDTFTELKGRPLHLSGESYGGRYLPIFAAAVLDGNKGRKEPIALKSVIIGNGVVDRFDLTLTHYESVCTRVSELKPLLGVAQCAAMQEVLPRCRAMMRAECEDRMDAIRCQNAIDFCYTHLKYPYYATGGNPFDMSKMCDGVNGCYEKDNANIADYLNNPEVRKHLGLSDQAGPFEGSSRRVAELFADALDHVGRTKYYVSSILERGDVNVLIYAGLYDYQCQFSHQKSWTSKLDWSGHAGFNALELEPWYMNRNATEARTRGKEVKGVTKTFGGLTLASIRGAGHMVPHDKPAESLEMLTRWLAHGRL